MLKKIKETLAEITKVLPYAVINAMHEIRYEVMEEIWKIYSEINEKYDFETVKSLLR